MKTNKKIFTAYCLSYGNWTVIPSHWRASFQDMKACGFDSVALSFSESEMRYARRTFEMQIYEAHQAGLKVIVIPSRIGGRFAGAPLMPSLWLSDHPASQLPENPMFACMEDESFITWSCDFIHTLFSDYDLDGLIWDEPKLPDYVTSHPAAVKKYGQGYSKEQACQGYAELLARWTAIARGLRPSISVSLFNLPNAHPEFTKLCAKMPGLDYLGFDGSLSLQSFFHEEPTKHKPYLWETWPRTQKECAETGCGTFALIENMLLPKSQQNAFYINLKDFLKTSHPDHLACYYYAHNNESPDEVHQLVMKAIRETYL